MDLGHSPDTGASEGELRSGYALTLSPSHSKNISLYYRKEDRGKSRLRGRLQLFFFNPLCGDFQLSPREFYLSLISEARNMPDGGYPSNCTPGLKQSW